MIQEISKAAVSSLSLQHFSLEHTTKFSAGQKIIINLLQCS
jgi:hypothetical protein